MKEMSLQPADVSTTDQVRAEVLDKLRTAPAFCVTIQVGDDEFISASVGEGHNDPRDLFLHNLVEAWDSLCEAVGEEWAVRAFAAALRVRRA